MPVFFSKNPYGFLEKKLKSHPTLVSGKPS